MMKGRGLKLKHFYLLVVFISVAILAGCINGKSPEEKIQTILEKSAAEESDFVEQQKPLNELEKSEKDIYDEIIKLGMKEYDQIVELSDEALDNIEDREQLIEKEHNSMQDSQKQFEKVKGQIKKIEDGEAKDQALKLEDTMQARYTAYEDLYNKYIKSIKQDRSLYELFKKEEVKMNELESQINLINDSYTEVINANENFNQLTKKFNEQKENFYEKIGIESEGSDKK